LQVFQAALARLMMSPNRINEALVRLRAAARLFPASQQPSFHDGASAQQVDALEKTLGHCIPEDLRVLLRACDAIVTMDVRNGYWVGGTDTLVRSYARGDFPRAISDGPTEAAAIPIATDGGGNAFLARVSDGSVWRLDYETGAIERIAATIDGFLLRVAEDWEHEAAGDLEWSYLV
jgi:hypothetical protein